MYLSVIKHALKRFCIEISSNNLFVSAPYATIKVYNISKLLKY